MVGYQGQIEWDTSKPEGAPRKLMDISRLNLLGWHAKVPLEEGLFMAYQWFLKNQDDFRK
ncbi:GDP-L-fucose synthase [Marinomonas posidonica]|uniref:GDP-L-fucose synthase n=1 Tax=Marinomonas posidonica TaxID=936476 RepID=UPI000307088A|nr:GDP-L-fucose synthase [Marinomonas posidonica]